MWKNVYLGLKQAELVLFGLLSTGISGMLMMDVRGVL